MKIAIIGSGISGLGCAYLLNKQHDITLFEANDYIGGHSRTVEIEVDNQKIPVDTGFIVFNYQCYPNLSSLFDHLQVDVAKSDMSFGVTIDNGWLEYGTLKLTNLIAQKKNLLRPKFWKMVKDILKFNKNAHKYLESDLTLKQMLDEMGMSKWFCDYYLLAMGASIWSTPTNKMFDFPAKTFVRFFKNHGLLTVKNQPQWFTVNGGSCQYVKKITASFKHKIKTNCAIKRIKRVEQGVVLTDVNDIEYNFDQVVFACHSDQALQILENPTSLEKSIIGDIKYQPNHMILHHDESFMQKNKKAWSSWVYLSEEKEDKTNNIILSYWMNNLQPLKTNKPIIVTLNPSVKPDKNKIFDEYTFEHPVFDENAVKAQARLNEINGVDKIWYCGAWQKYGFHEDGLASAVNVAEKIGVDIPWK